jgi:hypothetical protein
LSRVRVWRGEAENNGSKVAKGQALLHSRVFSRAVQHDAVKVGQGWKVKGDYCIPRYQISRHLVGRSLSPVTMKYQSLALLLFIGAAANVPTPSYPWHAVWIWPTCMGQRFSLTIMIGGVGRTRAMRGSGGLGRESIATMLARVGVTGICEFN